MDVTFTKLDRRYEVTIERSVSPALAPRVGPGFHKCVPHDAAHLFVELEAGLRGAVFGRLATGSDDGLFWPRETRDRKRPRRQAVTAQDRADMALSEKLAGVTVPLWEVERGLAEKDPTWPGTARDNDIDPRLLTSIYARYDEFSRRWHEARIGESVTVVWPSPRR
ncbi:hypothetical protein GOEFS_105_00710 [Gordonia effusa NBRC 100432]|uniref:Uncharacterized protein n=1 Tax=Gordonia effusa NBRC 100432 TaxID=1077974 RepID=H0R4Q9_9ACTN|nr:hypothetical protein [Gordonia effusa]GAB20060.1 hypothetical protein GOEFS_105_00710 [Gordonia effusa NBRC 100432]